MAERVKVIAVVSFEGVRVGDIAVTDMTPRLKALVAKGYMKITELDGYDGTIPGEQDGHPESGESSSRTGGSDGKPAGAEPSEGARSRRHRKAS